MQSPSSHPPQTSSHSNQCILKQWHIRRVGNKLLTLRRRQSDERVKLMAIAVEGVRINEDNTEQAWHSNLIVHRVAADKVRTNSGRVYILEGPMITKAALKEGFSREICDAFHNGFPEDWTTVLKPPENVQEPPRKRPKRQPTKKRAARAKQPISQQSTSISMKDAKKTRSGRSVVPPTAYWRQERTVHDLDGSLIGIDEGDPDWATPTHLHVKKKAKPKAKPKPKAKKKVRIMEDVYESDFSTSHSEPLDDSGDEDYIIDTPWDKKRMEPEWTREQLDALNQAQFAVDPRSDHFWEQVAAHVDEKTAEECQRQVQSDVLAEKKKPKQNKANEDDGIVGLKLTSPLAGKGTMKRSKQLRTALQRADVTHEDDAMDATPYRIAAQTAMAAVPAVPPTPATPISIGPITRSKPRIEHDSESEMDSPEFLHSVERDQVARYTYQIRKTQRAIGGIGALRHASIRGAMKGSTTKVTDALRDVQEAADHITMKEEGEDSDQEDDFYWSDD